MKPEEPEMQLGTITELEEMFKIVYFPEFVEVKGTRYAGFTLEEIIADQQAKHPDRLADLCARLPQEPLEDGEGIAFARGFMYALVPALAMWAVGWALVKIWERW